MAVDALAVFQNMINAGFKPSEAFYALYLMSMRHERTIDQEEYQEFMKWQSEKNREKMDEMLGLMKSHD